METTPIMKQIMDANKMLFDNTMDIMVKSQEQAEAAIDTMLDSNARFSNETKQTVAQWAKLSKKGCDDFKAITDKGLQTVQQLFNL
jgi:uncharacterized ferritin-like protein (DUF455 family)